MRYAQSFAPGHITGFVEFPILDGDPLTLGSRGAGVCIDKGILTKVFIEEYKEDKTYIYINDLLCNNAEVSKYVVDYYLNILNKNRYKIIIKHYSKIPIGYGLGSSGAAALSLSLALNSIFGLFDEVKAAQIAHIADLKCRCGMGTVIAEYYGGFEMRLRPGAPGIGYVKNLEYDKDKVIILCLNPLPTKEFLTNRISLINGIGGRMLELLEREPTIDNFLNLSFQFVKRLGFVSKRVYYIINKLMEHGYTASMALFGETVFTIVKNEDVEKVCNILREYGEPIVASIGKGVKGDT